jgi:LmbE family N-acetylglucosaminyl deacetylase
MNNVLVIAAHPDDEVLGMGGTISKLTANNKKVHVLFMSEGVTARDNLFDPIARESDIKDRIKMSERSAKILRVSSLEYLNLKDNRMDGIELLDIVKKIEGIIKKIEPDCIFTHSENDLNIDHQITNKAVITATRPLSECKVKEIYTFEILSSSEWGFSENNHLFSPKYFVDISSFIEDKIKAINCYSEEMREHPHPRSVESIMAQSSMRGSQIGVRNAEAFGIVRILQ